MAEILSPSEASFAKVSEALTLGDVVALPTETVYGLAAIISDDAALRKIFEVKGRPSFDPLIIHVLGLSSLLELVDVPPSVFSKLQALVDAFCPGPLTFVLRKKKSISDIITAGKKTVAIRIPAHPVFREVLRRAGPLAAPSANPFGYVSPTRAEHVRQSLGDKIKYILDGGPCSVGVESTILDLSSQKLAILRPGAVTAEMITDVLGEPVTPCKTIATTDPSAPGMLIRHYSPKTRLRLFQNPGELRALLEQNSGSRVAIVCCTRSEMEHFSRAIVLKNSAQPKQQCFCLSETGGLAEIASHVFDCLQKLDAMGFDSIFMQTPLKEGLGIAINDRLARAAAKFRA
ncbi:MAG: L-threonylcarbamoyladenylate synthase [Verrucomicrobiota bacterium]|nr:MAG: L-threonylcarbamoyladenylate synthase [Verrucomicrobiota bacterium]